MATENTVWIDNDAAAYGWLGARGVDLSSVVTHEFGHVLGFDHDYRDSVMASTLLPGESRLGRSRIEDLNANLAPVLLTGREAHDTLFIQLGRGDASQFGGNDLLVASREEHAATVGLITQDDNESQLIDRLHVHAYDLDGADDDEWDLLLGKRAELHVDVKAGGIEQLL